MSLINQMLNDLDRRTPAGAPAEASTESGLPAGVASTDRRGMRPRSIRPGLLAMLLIAAGAAAWLWAAGWPPVGRIAVQAAARSAPGVPEAAAAVVRAPMDIHAAPPDPLPGNSAAPVAPPPVEEETSPAVLESLVIVQVGEQLRVAAAFSHMPAYRLVRQARGRQLALELPAGTQTVPLPDSGAPPLLEKIAYDAAEGSVRLVFSFDRACGYEELQLTDRPHAAGQTLIFVIQPEPSEIEPVVVAATPSPVESSGTPHEDPTDAAPATPPAESAFARQRVTPTPHERAEALWRTGIAAFQKGRFAEAETALQAALAIAADHIGARDALLQLLDRQDRQRQVRALLAEGVQEAPAHLPYRLRYARLLIEEGDLPTARAELTRPPLPSVAEAPDLYAMLATVQLRQGCYGEAADTYRRLLAAKPEQAVWWMGLGIALEGDAAVDQARHAYGQALVHEGLSEQLRTFIRQRLAASGDVPPRHPTTHRNPDEDRS